MLYSPVFRACLSDKLSYNLMTQGLQGLSRKLGVVVKIIGCNLLIIFSDLQLLVLELVLYICVCAIRERPFS
jgi:hypothetical protein